MLASEPAAVNGSFLSSAACPPPSVRVSFPQKKEADMLKAARFLFLLSVAFVLIGAVSIYFSLTTGEKALSSSAIQSLDNADEVIARTKATLETLRAHLGTKVVQLIGGLVAGISGYIATKARKRDLRLFVPYGICAAFLVLALALGYWIVGALELVALALSFVKIWKLTEGGAVIPED
jgi:hypothetical protein